MEIAEAKKRILDNTYTKTDYYKRLLLLEDFLQHVVYSSEKSHDDLLEILTAYGTQTQHEVVDAVARWGREVLEMFAPNRVHEQIQALRASIEQAPELVLYIPTAFGPAEIEMVGKWCRASVDPEVLLDLRIDPKIAGGCAFVWKNAFYDFSLEYFMHKEKQKLLDLLGSYSPS